MGDDMNTIIVGVDGGGTKTKISVVDEDGTVIKNAEGSNINYNNIGVEKAFINFKQIMDQLHIDYGSVRALSIGDPALDDILRQSAYGKFPL